jgi:hypothetical protein
MEATIRGIPVEKLLQAYDARERARLRVRETRGDNDRIYRMAHQEERKAYNKQYYELKKAELQAVDGYVQPKRGRKPKPQTD